MDGGDADLAPTLAEQRAFSPNTLRRKGENMAKALARIMIGKVVDRRRKSDIEREAAQKVLERNK